jgi:photosystem II stability/assembly factor-like uncharacterized protein
LGKRSLVAALALLLAAPAHAQFGYTWKPVKIGAGGWITGMDLSPDGTTRMVRTDTYGAYLWNASSSRWEQLVSIDRMPASTHHVEFLAQGVYEIVAAPSDPLRLYMALGGRVFKSTNRGTTWTETGFTPVAMDANSSYRVAGDKMVVHPTNPDVVWLGTQRSGLWTTTDGGATWSKVTAVPDGGTIGSSQEGNLGLVARGAGRDAEIWTMSTDHGFYRSTDGGHAWSRVSGGPRSALHVELASDGTLYATAFEPQGGDPNGVWRWTSEAGWADINPSTGQYYHSITLDPHDPNRIVVATDGGSVQVSRNRGSSWDAPMARVTRESSDTIPWLEWTEENYMSNGGMTFDPVNSGKLWFNQGIGVWYTVLSSGAQTSLQWIGSSIGIEQLVGNSISVPPGTSHVYLGFWDRAVFRILNPDVYPSTHGPTARFNHGGYVGWTAEDPSVVLAIVCDSRGQIGDGLDVQTATLDDDAPSPTWTYLRGLPNGLDPAPDTTDPKNACWGHPGHPMHGFGTAAAASPNSMLWMPAKTGNRLAPAPYRTTNGGSSWSRVTLPGVPDTEAGWGGAIWAYYLKRHIVEADKHSIGTYYIYLTPTSASAPGGIWRSTDHGARWTQIFDGELSGGSGFNAKLRGPPNHGGYRGGHLFFSSGQQGATPATTLPPGGPSGSFMRSTDGGATWAAVPNVLEVLDFGFGTVARGDSYPTLYIAGWVDGRYGIWKSRNANASPIANVTWTQIGDFPLGSVDMPVAVDGDKAVDGRVYLSFAGSGAAYGEPDR